MTDRPERSLFERDILRGRDRRLAPQARPAHDGPQPGHVRGRGRRGADDRDLGRRRSATIPGWFTFTVAVWLWLTVLFGNFAEAIAEGRGKAQADTLRAMRTQTVARLRDGARSPPTSCTAATSSSSRPAR